MAQVACPPMPDSPVQVRRSPAVAGPFLGELFARGLLGLRQLSRRACPEAAGGFRPATAGGVEWARFGLELPMDLAPSAVAVR